MKKKFYLIAVLFLATTQLIACTSDNNANNNWHYDPEKIKEAEEQLEVCPWCGSSDVEFTRGVNSNQPIIGCNNCYAQGPICDSETWSLENAVKKWNSLPREEANSDEINDDSEAATDYWDSDHVAIPDIGSTINEESIPKGGYSSSFFPTEIESCQVKTDNNGKRYLTYVKNGEESEKYYLADDFHFYLEFCDYSRPTDDSQCTTDCQEVSLNSGLKIWESNLSFGGEHTHTTFCWLSKDNDLLDEIYWDQSTMEPSYFDVKFEYLSSVTLTYHLNSKRN